MAADQVKILALSELVVVCFSGRGASNGHGILVVGAEISTKGIPVGLVLGDWDLQFLESTNHVLCAVQAIIVSDWYRFKVFGGFGVLTCCRPEEGRIARVHIPRSTMSGGIKGYVVLGHKSVAWGSELLVLCK